MNIQPLGLVGVMHLLPRQIGDNRGYFAETFRADVFERHIGCYNFVQDNESYSAQAGTVRGLHFQCEPRTQGKLVRCTAGALFDVVVDIRVGSPTFGHWLGETLTPAAGNQLWVPPGFAHGFCTLEPDTVISYKVTDYYDAECDRGLSWDDPAVGIDWPAIANAALLSPKDRKLPPLSDLPNFFSWSA